MVYVLSGPNTQLLHQKLHELIARFRQECGESIERFDGVEITHIDNVLDAVRSVSFLEPRKLVIVKNFAQNKTILDSIETIVEQTADSTDLILVDQKIDKRTAAYTFLKKNTELFVAQELNPHELRAWVVSTARELGVECRPAEAKYLIDRAGTNQLLVHSELQKLALYNSVVTKEAIDMLVEPTPQSNIFSMLEALFKGDLRSSTELYADQRMQGEEPQKIIAMLVWQLQQLVTALFVPSRTKQALIEQGISPYSAEKALALSSKITKKNLVFYVQELARIDAQTKTNADVESALAVYFATIAERQKVIS